MTASQIIDEIKSLTPEEQAGVVRFVYQLDAERKLSGPELSTLAERLVNAEDPAEVIEALNEGTLFDRPAQAFLDAARERRLFISCPEPDD